MEDQKPRDVCVTRELISKELHCQPGSLLAPKPMFCLPHHAHKEPNFRLALKRMGRQNNNSTENATPTATVNINAKYKLHRPFNIMKNNF